MTKAMKKDMDVSSCHYLPGNSLKLEDQPLPLKGDGYQLRKLLLIEVVRQKMGSGKNHVIKEIWMSHIG
jgi:hypothetical protein